MAFTSEISNINTIRNQLLEFDVVRFFREHQGIVVKGEGEGDTIEGSISKGIWRIIGGDSTKSQIKRHDERRLRHLAPSN